MSETMEKMPQETRPRRPWRWLKLTGLSALAILGLGLIWFAVANGRANARFAAKIQELRDQKLPTSLAELASAPVPPDSNAVTFMRRAQVGVKAIQDDVSAAYDTAGESDQEEFDRGVPSPGMLSAIRSAFDAYPNVWPLLLRASKCPNYDLQLDYDVDSTVFLEKLIDVVQDSRAEIRILNLRVMLLLSENKGQEAVETCLAMLRLSRHFDHNPMIVSNLVAAAVRGVAIDAASRSLGSGSLPKAAHDALEAELASHDLVESYRHALRTERPFGIRQIQSFRDSIPGSTWTLRFLYDECGYLDVIDGAIRNADLPYSEAQAKNEAIQQDKGMLTQTATPRIKHHLEVLTRAQAKQRSLRVLNQLVLQDPTGEKVLTINQLGLPAEATIDPFDGKPLRIKHTDAGWLVYSVGKNLQDDGGKLDDDRTDVGVGPIELAPSR